MIPSPGRIVQYTLSEQDADAIARRRTDGLNAGPDDRATGAVIHTGNPVAAGDTLPMLIVKAWGSAEDSCVQGQVFLDGNDTLWVTSVQQGDGERHWREFPRV